MNDTPETPATDTKVAAAIAHENNDIGNTLGNRMHFSMVQAEVIYESKAGIASRRTQFFSKGEDQRFPMARLMQIQSVAAMQVREENKTEKKFEILEILLHTIVPLGYFTDEEFYGGVPVPEIIPEPAPAPESDTATDGNVVPIKPQ